MIKYIYHTNTRYTNEKGEYHNPHGPSLVLNCDTIIYCINGKRHNIVGPAKIYCFVSMDTPEEFPPIPRYTNAYIINGNDIGNGFT